MPQATLSRQQNTAEIVQARGLYSRKLSVGDVSTDPEERSFTAVITTETPATILDQRSWEWIDEILIASGGMFAEHMPLLQNHERCELLDVIGSAVDFEQFSNPARWEARGIIASPVNADDPLEGIWQRVVQGHLRAVSIGYNVHEFVDIPPGSAQNINGRNFEAGNRVLRVSTRWQAHELSLTPIPADQFALIHQRHHQNTPTPPTKGIFR